MGDDPSVAVRGPVAAAHKRSAFRKTSYIVTPVEIVRPVNSSFSRHFSAFFQIYSSLFCICLCVFLSFCSYL